MSNFRRFLSAMPYGSEDYQQLGLVFVSHARLLTAGAAMGTAFVGVNYLLTNEELGNKIAELKRGGGSRMLQS